MGRKESIIRDCLLYTGVRFLLRLLSKMAVRLQDLKRMMREKQRKEGRLVDEGTQEKTHLRYYLLINGEK